jgi:hypothetical protein
MGLSILKLLEAKLMCMQFEDFLQDFKPLVKEIDPYQAILKALTFRPNSPSLSFPAIKTTTKTTFMSFSSSTQQQQEQQQQQQQQLQLQQKHHHQKQQFIQEDTIVYLSRLYFQQHSSNRIKQNGRRGGIPPRTFELHRTLPPNLSQAIMKGNLSIVKEHWYQMMNFVPATKLNSSRVSTTQKDHLLSLRTTILIKDIEILLANEILHFSIWYGQVSIAQFAIEEAGANVNNMDDNQLTPLHFSVLRNQPDLARLLLSFGANRSLCGGTWSGSIQGLTPLETAKYWIFCDTKAVQLVLENEICIYCNTKFDKVPVLHLVAFEGNSICCEKCQLHFCRLPQPCLHQHLCPKKENYHCLQQQQPKEQEEEEEDIDETTSTSSSLSATTEPFVMINYPSSTTINNQTNENITSPHENENSHSGSLLLKQFIKSTAKWKSQIDSDHHRKQKQMNRKMSIEFSKIPQWYCNHVDCHQVFASFFKNANECTKCKGLFCSIHIIVQNSNTVDVSKLCVQCNTV